MYRVGTMLRSIPRATLQSESPRFTIRSRSLNSTPKVQSLRDYFDSSKGFLWSEAEYATGRGWLAAELRNKSFEDLHQLWFVCLKELNKLYSNQQEARRFKLFFDARRMGECKKTMARLKLVLWERRQAYLDALAIKESIGDESAIATLLASKGRKSKKPKALPKHKSTSWTVV